MAGRNNGDVEDKGRRLWDALKNKKLGHVERKSIIRELLQNGAPANFREPDKQVRKLYKYGSCSYFFAAALLNLTLTNEN